MDKQSLASEAKISFDDFSKVDIRIGTVVKAEVPEWSHWVMKLTVDFGLEVGERTIFAGIMKWYKPGDLEKKQFPFVINIEPKKIGPKGDKSSGMMLAVCNPQNEEEKPLLFQLPEKVENGTKVR